MSSEGPSEPGTDGGEPPLSSQQPAAAAVTYNWKPVTGRFLDACKTLSLGELMHDELFGLFEAMSAIEMMDPKMDAGMRCNNPHFTAEGRKSQPLTFRTAVESGRLPMDEKTTSTRDVIDIVDETVARFVTWLEGHSLAQTIFTNLYLHAPAEVTHPTLRAFSVVTLKLVDVAKDFVSKGAVYEEEDFQPLAYGFKLAGDVSELRAAGMLREVEDELHKTVRESKRNGETDRNLDAASLLARIKFLRFLYVGLTSLYKLDVREGAKLLQSAIDQLSKILSDPNLDSAITTRTPGFEPHANQRLLPPTFPRYTEIKTKKSAYRHLDGLCRRLLAATATEANFRSFRTALEFFVDFSLSSPCILSRSVLQSLYQPLHIFHASGGTVQPFQDQLRDDCKSFLALTDKSSPVKEHLDNFFSRCCRPMCLLMQTFGHNRARQREKIPPLLEELAVVQEEADKLDATFGTLHLSTWLLHHVLRLMIRYVLSGFELELFSSHEYGYAFWYLHELLYPWLINCLHRSDACSSERELMLLAAARKKSKNKKQQQQRPPVRAMAKEIALCQGYAAMCSGYFKLVVGLRKDGKISIPDPTFDNEAVRYERRFLPFGNLLTPPLMPYGQYVEVYRIAAASDASILYVTAARDFGRARHFFETSEQPSSSLCTVTKTNMVASSVLSKDSSRMVEFDFNIHSTFPVVKFV